jgi:hypothetical protein
MSESGKQSLGTTLSRFAGQLRPTPRAMFHKQGDPSLRDGKSEWHSSREGRRRSLQTRVASESRTLSNLQVELEAPGDVSDVESECRSESLWEEAGVRRRGMPLSSPPRMRKPTWGRPRSRTPEARDYGWARHGSSRPRSASRERTRVLAGTASDESRVRRALRRHRANVNHGGMLVGDAALAFESLLEETLGAKVASSDLELARSRMRLSRRLGSTTEHASPAAGTVRQSSRAPSSGRIRSATQSVRSRSADQPPTSPNVRAWREVFGGEQVESTLPPRGFPLATHDLLRRTQQSVSILQGSSS